MLGLVPSLPREVTLDLVFVLGNIALTMRAVWFNVGEWRHGFRELRWISGWRALLAAVYCVSYILLTFLAVDRLFWSHVMVGFAWPVWEIVWVRPAKMNRALREALVRQGVTNIEERRRLDGAA